MSIHPVTTNEEMDYILDALEQLAQHHVAWIKDYHYDIRTTEFSHRTAESEETKLVAKWFSTELV